MTGKLEAPSETLGDLILKLDVDAVGIASLAQWKGTPLEASALRLLPQARSVVVFAMEVYREVLDLVSPGRTTGAASLNDLLNTRVDYLSSRLTKASYDVAKASRHLGLKALPLPAAGCPTDARFLQAVFSYKHAAQATGLGTLGKHSLLITPRFGARVRLSCCLTEAALEPTRGNSPWDCAGCNTCVEDCPARALSDPQSGEAYAINKFACSSFRTAAGGCSEYQRLCPAGP